jgi:hypothetical protein
VKVCVAILLQIMLNMAISIAAFTFRRRPPGGGTTVTIELQRGLTESNPSDPPIADLAQAA